jgi:peptidoglycan/xylan/chitin deacetylase (PgdA/CDA1 family)
MLHMIGAGAEKFCVTSRTFRELFAIGDRCRFMFDDGYSAIYPHLVSAKNEIYSRITIFPVAGKVGGANDWDTSGELAGKPLLSWDQLGELRIRGVRIGSHGLTHADLTKLNAKELERETKDSKNILEDRLGELVVGFAYPYGYFNDRVISAVKDAGYKWAVTTSDSIWEGRSNPYRMRRINISGRDPDWLIRAKLNGLYDVKSVWELPKLLFEKMVIGITGNS